MSMQSQVNVAPFKKYSPLGKVPAVSLTNELPPGLNADILLLSCGDVRNILYTIFCEEDNGMLIPSRIDLRFSEEIGHNL